MKRKMQDFALAGKCVPGKAGCTPSARTPSLANIHAMAVPKKPFPACQRNSRRVRPQENWNGSFIQLR